MSKYYFFIASLGFLVAVLVLSGFVLTNRRGSNDGSSGIYSGSSQFGDANNTKRRSDVTQILNAIGAYAADNKGELPQPITTTASKISKTGIDICSLLVGDYIPSLPIDPSIEGGQINDGDGVSIEECASDYETGYSVMKDANDRVTVEARLAENGEKITISR